LDTADDEDPPVEDTPVEDTPVACLTRDLAIAVPAIAVPAAEVPAIFVPTEVPEDVPIAEAAVEAETRESWYGSETQPNVFTVSAPKTSPTANGLLQDARMDKD